MAGLKDFNEKYASSYIKAAELEGAEFRIMAARKQDGQFGEQVAFDLDLGIGPWRTLTLSVTPYRLSFVTYFANETEPIGPVRLVKQYSNSGQEFWGFEEVEEGGDEREDLPF